MGKPNLADFEDFSVDRQFMDLDLFYGFDLGKEWLHNFSVRLSVPISLAQPSGFIHPHGTPLIDLHAEGENFELGDIGLSVKKKFVEQASYPNSNRGRRWRTFSDRFERRKVQRQQSHQGDSAGSRGYRRSSKPSTQRASVHRCLIGSTKSGDAVSI
jgi:hypothetical protein